MLTNIIINEEILRTLLIYLIVIRFALDIIVEYLVKTNKIKSNKISRIFYYDDESLVKFWEKVQEKGMLKYIIKETINITIIMGIVGIFFKLFNLEVFGNEQNQIFRTLIIGIILGLVLGLMRWVAFNNRYNKFKEKC